MIYTGHESGTLYKIMIELIKKNKELTKNHYASQCLPGE